MDTSTSAGLRKESLTFPSADGTTQIHAKIVWPEGEPKAIFQIVHGMAEHISRYERFAEYLAPCRIRRLRP
jgi:alpha-beta hydrolase superfamily lysophospholipase